MAPLWRYGPFGPISVPSVQHAHPRIGRKTGTPIWPGGAPPARRYAPWSVKSAVEPLEGNKVKLSVEVDEAEFDKAIDAAFQQASPARSASPGFRPGKAPRRILEARIGTDVGPRARRCATRCPSTTPRRCSEHDVDVIAAPEIDITAGEDDGPVAFDAVVEVRPDGRSCPATAACGSTIAAPEADRRGDRRRRSTGCATQFGELDDVDRPAIDGDYVTIDIAGTQRRRAGRRARPPRTTSTRSAAARSCPSSTSTSRGAKAGDNLEFDADHPDPDEEPGRLPRRSSRRSRRRCCPSVDRRVGERGVASSRPSTSCAPTSPTRIDDRAARCRRRWRCARRPATALGRAGRRRAARGAGQRRDAAAARRTSPCASRPRASTLEQYLAATGQDQADVRRGAARRRRRGGQGRPRPAGRRRGRGDRGRRRRARRRVSSASPSARRARSRTRCARQFERNDAGPGGTLRPPQAQGARLAGRARRDRRRRGPTDRPGRCSMPDERADRRRGRRPTTADRATAADATETTTSRTTSDRPDPATTSSPRSSSRPTGASGPTTSTPGCSRRTSSSSARRSTTRSPTWSAPSCCTSSRRTPTRTSTSTSTAPVATSRRCSRSTTRCSSSSPTSPRSASARRRRRRRCCWRPAPRASASRCPHARDPAPPAVRRQRLRPGHRHRDRGQGDPADARPARGDPGPPHRPADRADPQGHRPRLRDVSATRPRSTASSTR